MNKNSIINRNGKSTFFYLFFIIFLFSAGTLKANDAVSFQASTPSSRVVLNQPFQVSFTVNANGRDFRLPEITDFDILAGPFTSTSSSMSIVNGQQQTSVSERYTFTLMARRVGTFTIPSASITVRGQRYTSSGLSIEVLPEDAQQPAQQQNNQGGRTQQNQPANNEISSENLFMRTIVSRTEVFEQEAILLTYRLYTRLDILDAGVRNLPDFRGFMKNDLEVPRQLTLENYRGQNYSVVDLFQTILYPQRAGTIEIPSAEFEAIIRVQNNQNVRRSIFDSFFDSHTNVSRNLTAPAVRINVKEPPTANRPMAFAGTVGNFRMSSSISAEEVTVNEAVTMQIIIEGTGNMRMLGTPEVRLPESFERWDPRVSNDFRTTTAGVSGRRTIEYMFIPRHSGDFEIPSVELVFFDLQSQTFRTLRTPVYPLNVLRGDNENATAAGGTFLGREEVRQLARDIRYIRTNDFAIAQEQTPKIGSLTSWLMYLTPLVLTLLVFIILSKQAKENANISLIRNKMANKMARKRLKLAQKLLNEGKKDKFYDEVLKAVWNYLSDKMSIPVSSLTKDNIESELKSRQVDETTIKQLFNILNTCEFARYAPNSGQQEMGNLFEETVQVISDLEGKVK
jgi:hypothetical protein